MKESRKKCKTLDSRDEREQEMISGIVDKPRSALSRMLPQNSLTFALFIGFKNHPRSPRGFNVDKTPMQFNMLLPI